MATENLNIVITADVQDAVNKVKAVKNNLTDINKNSGISQMKSDFSEGATAASQLTNKLAGLRGISLTGLVAEFADVVSTMNASKVATAKMAAEIKYYETCVKNAKKELVTLNAELELWESRDPATVAGIDDDTIANNIKSVKSEISSLTKGLQKDTAKLDGLNEAAAASSGKLFGVISKGALAAAAAVAVVVGAIAGLVGAVKSAIRYSEQLRNTFFEAHKVGLTTASYQELSYVLGQVGVESDKLSDFIKSLSAAQNDLRDGSEGMVNAFKTLGLSVEEATTMTQEELFVETIKRLQEMEDGIERTGVAYRIFGEDDAAQVANLMSLNNQEMERMINNFYLLGGGATDSAVQKSLELQSALSNMKLAWQGIANTIGEAVMPALTAVVNGLATAFAWVNMFLRAVLGLDIVAKGSKNMNKAAASAGGYGASLKKAAGAAEELRRSTMGFDELNVVPSGKSGGGGGSDSDIGGGGGGGSFEMPEIDGLSKDLGLDKMAEHFEKFKAAYQTWVPIVLMAIGAGMAAAGFITGNIALGIAGIGIAGLGIAANFSNGNWSKWTKAAGEAFKKFGKTIKNALKAVGDFFVKVGKAIADAAKKIWKAAADFVVKVWEGAKKTVTNVWNAIKTFLTNCWNGIKSVATTVWNAIAKFFSDLWNSIKSVATTAWNAIKKFFTDTWNSIKSTATTVWNAISKFFSDTWNSIKNTATNVWNAISKFFTDLWNGIKTTATNIWNAISQFFTNCWNGIKTTATNVWNAIKQFFTDTWNSIKTTATNAWNGIKSMLETAWNAVKTTANTLCENLKKFFSDCWDAIKKVWSVVKDFFQDIWDNVKTGASNLVENVKTFFTNAWNTIKGVWDVVKKFFQDIWDGIKNSASSLMESVKNFFINAWNAIKGVWDTVKGYFQDIWNAIKNAASSMWDSVKGFFSGAWTAIKNVWNGAGTWFGSIWTGIKNAFSGVSTWFGDIFGGAWTAVKNAWSGVKTWFSNAWDGIKSVFTNAGTAISDGITGALKKTFNSFVSGAVGLINKFIKAINGAIDLINKIPGVNIGKLSTLTVPQLAKGGIVTDSILANIGERGKEAVLPLENNTGWMDALADRIAARNGSTRVVLQVDGRELGWATIEQINAITKQTGGLQLVL